MSELPIVVKNRARQTVPIKSWAEDIFTDGTVMEEFYALASLPFVYRHVAAMPDAHASGHGMPIGGVVATERYVIPNAIGVDIGCGMSARRTTIKVEELRASDSNHGTVLKKILGNIRRNVPVGNASHQKYDSSSPDHFELASFLVPTSGTMWYPSSDIITIAHKQFGTLGGGNHFIELDQDDEGFVWLMLHSGSRRFGKEICDFFNKLAANINTKYQSSVPKSAQLAFLPMDTDEGKSYMYWMQIAMAYAFLNRKAMVDSCLNSLFSTVDGETTESIDTHHNYAQMEHHFGHNVLITRKGAVRARMGEKVIIPGSMETGSYIAEGLGNEETFMTCSHGAGRAMSRNKAKSVRSVQDMVESMQKQGIELTTDRVDAVLDEGGHAYKDIDVVMANSATLVTPLYHLSPLGVVKGG